MRKYRTITIREDAGDDMTLRVPLPPEAIWKGRVQCPHCSTTFEPYDKYDTHPQCSECGNLVDLTAHLKQQEHPGMTPAA